MEKGYIREMAKARSLQGIAEHGNKFVFYSKIHGKPSGGLDMGKNLILYFEWVVPTAV